MPFTQVNDITNFSPLQAIINTETEITALVTPSNATNKEIIWSLVSPSGGATFRTTGTGTNKRTYITPRVSGRLEIRATIIHGLEE